MTLATDECTANVRVSEEGLQSRAHWERTQSTMTWELGSMVRRPAPLSSYEACATGRLCLEFTGDAKSGRVRSWADRRSWHVEDKLGEVLWELEMRTVEARDARLDVERARVAAERNWHAAMIQAKSDHLEHRRTEELLDQVERWRRAEGIRAYCDAMASTHSDDRAVSAWAQWARSRADALDPLPSISGFPAIADARPEDLRPFLNGLSPYGADALW